MFPKSDNHWMFTLVRRDRWADFVSTDLERTGLPRFRYLYCEVPQYRGWKLLYFERQYYTEDQKYCTI